MGVAASGLGQERPLGAAEGLTEACLGMVRSCRLGSHQPEVPVRDNRRGLAEFPVGEG